MYIISLKFEDKKEKKLKAKTLIDALSLLIPEIVKNKAVLNISKGKLKANIPLSPFQVKRLMINKVYKEITAKRIEMMLR